ncbi:hypothetical protein [Marinobacterium aestuariivivens]|uniref:Double Cache domain-containing protein n=1 Tax=Marinobacterium aestuariivivens TaxID=1698799 RepID=A0ABW2A544_9GAMM
MINSIRPLRLLIALLSLMMLLSVLGFGWFSWLEVRQEVTRQLHQQNASFIDQTEAFFRPQEQLLLSATQPLVRDNKLRRSELEAALQTLSTAVPELKSLGVLDRRGELLLSVGAPCRMISPCRPRTPSPRPAIPERSSLAACSARRTPVGRCCRRLSRCRTKKATCWRLWSRPTASWAKPRSGNR